MPTRLTTGAATVVAGTTPDLVAELYENDCSALVKTQISSVTLSIRNCDGNTINGRSSTDINDTGIGSLADVTVDGTDVVRLTIKPTVDDTAYQGDKREEQSHFWEIKWGYNDGDGVTRTGGEIYEITIERPPTS